MEEKMISVIVPVYMVENYLTECLDSIINQTYKNIEVLLIDDGSKDNSGMICDRYAEAHKNIKVIHKENGGLSSARNEGLKLARGNFISFIDSDDYLNTDMFSIMMEEQEKYNADVVICGRTYVYGDRQVVRAKSDVRKVMGSAEAIALMNTSILGYYDVAAWDKLYRRELFENIEFPIKKLSEDWYTTYKVFDKANVIVYNSKPLYYYRQRENSITHNRTVNWDSMKASYEVMEYVKCKTPQYIKEAEFSYTFATVGVIDNLIEQRKINRSQIFELIQKIKPYLKETYTYPGLSKKRIMQLKLLKFFPNLYIKVFASAKKVSERL